MDHHYKVFVTTFYKFLFDMNRYVPTQELHDVLESYKDLDMVKVVPVVYSILKEREKYIFERDNSMFDESLLILPTIDVSLLWTKMNKNQQEKIITYLNMLIIQIDIFYDAQEMEKQIVKCEKEEFNPYIGVGMDNPEYCINDILESIPVIEDDKPVGVGVQTLIKMIGLDKMININDFLDKLRTMTQEDIDNATEIVRNSIANSNASESTANLISGILTDVSSELKNSDINSDDPFKTISNVIATVSDKVKDSITGGDISLEQLQESAGAFANQFKDENGKQMFNNGCNPFDLLKRFTQGGMTENQCINSCSDMMKEMGVNMDIHQMMNQVRGRGRGQGSRRGFRGRGKK